MAKSALGTCSHCQWWTRIDKMPAPEDCVGVCKRLPPVGLDSEGFGQHPKTFADAGCGEFKPAPRLRERPAKKGR